MYRIPAEHCKIRGTITLGLKNGEMLWILRDGSSSFTLHGNMDAGDYTVHIDLPHKSILNNFKVVLDEECELHVACVLAFLFFSRTNGRNCMPMNHAFLQIAKCSTKRRARRWPLKPTMTTVTKMQAITMFRDSHSFSFFTRSNTLTDTLQSATTTIALSACLRGLQSAARDRRRVECTKADT